MDMTIFCRCSNQFSEIKMTILVDAETPATLQQHQFHELEMTQMG
jgi:hypothetical protein